jgi:Zn-finger nucleic acid-binding protein
MPHLKCAACRVRLYRAGEQGSEVDACPVCGQPLQAVQDLAGLVGFRRLEAHGRPPSAGYDAIAQSVVQVIARRRAAERRSRPWTP